VKIEHRLMEIAQEAADLIEEQDARISDLEGKASALLGDVEDLKAELKEGRE